MEPNLTETQKKALLSMKKAMGTLANAIKMLEEDEYCPDIIIQMDAVIGSVKSAKRNILTGHLDNCLQEDLNQNKDKTVKELIKIYRLGDE